jgi:predicted dehydrogenase/nucleoside-diphosphate-sugar epimerase
MTPTPLTVCIVGCGAITEQSYLPALDAMPEATVVSLIDRNLGRAKLLAERHGIPHYASSVDELPPGVEAAIVAVPHSLHRPVSCDLMRKGLHVLCEKPFAISTADAEAMIQCARESGVQLVSANICRYFWCNQEMRRLVESRTLGKLTGFRMVEGAVHNWPTVSGFFFDKKMAGGGILMDLGAHLVDLLLWWVNDYPAEVRYRDDAFGGVESECEIDLKFGPSISGSIKMSRLQDLGGSYRLEFERGSAEFRPFDPSGIANSITIESGGKKSFLKADRELQFTGYFEEQLRDFASTVRAGREGICAARQIAPSIRLIEECYAKAQPLSPPWLRGGVADTPKDGIVDLNTAKVLVTGASGFIGGRIVERLCLDYQNPPRSLLRSYSKAARIARFPTEIMIGDVLDQDAVRKAVAGSDVVVHAAVGVTMDDDLNTRVDIEGTENVCRAAVEAGVKRLVFLSTVEIYGQNQPKSVDEDTPPQKAVYAYGSSKLAAEQVCLRYQKEHGLSVVILRLAVVIGPYASLTVDAINRLKNSGYCKSKRFNGACNPVYIDDCVDAIFRAGTLKGIDGQTFLISGGETLTWNAYFEQHNRMLGLPPLRNASDLELKFYSLVQRTWDGLSKKVDTQQVVDLKYKYKTLRARSWMPNVQALIKRGGLLMAEEVFSRQAHYSIEKSRRLLGYQPRYSFERSLELIGSWHRSSAN